MRRLTLLGSTGSIGTSTLDVVRQRADSYGVFALVAGKNVAALARQIEEFRPEVAVVATESDRMNLIVRLAESGLPSRLWPELLHGPQARVAAAVAPDADFVLSAIVGVAGLEATFEAVRRRKTIGLANKEVLVASGALIMQAAGEAGTELIPVDSEHNGAHQCLRAGLRTEVARLYLTASGGPFRETPAEELESVTPEQALNHPTWRMGPRITIDSATLMNKGFEVIEACWLFGFAPREVTVVVHPQSSVHAMIEYVDGSLIAQVSATDMRMPIQYAMSYPERWAAPVPRLDWSEPRSWTFGPPDLGRFPLLRLAYEAQEAGGSATCTLNAADEIAVESFLGRRISFPAIAEVVEETLNLVPVRHPRSIGEVLEIDRESREVARGLVREWSAESPADGPQAAALTRVQA
jgi:1-deoxy-D-xylulose-5-phosphate reductoisomerase